jgi:hypothetical protein
MMKIGKSAGKDYAYIIGVYLGDGCVTHTPEGYLVFRVNTIDEDFALAIKSALCRLSNSPVNICKHEVKKSSKPNYSLRFGDQIVCRRLVETTCNKMFLPATWIEWSKDMRKSLIVGLMDSEGFVAANSNPTNRRYYMGFKCCDPWIYDFMRLLQSVGVIHGKVQVEKPYKLGYKPATRFTIKMQSWLDSGMRFNIKRKQDRVDEWAEAGPYERRKRTPRKSTSETIRQAA